MRLVALTLAIASLSTGLQAAPKRSAHKASTRTTAAGAIHVVHKGETAAKVARTYGLSLDQLAALNPGKSLTKLSVGTKLNVQKPKAAGPVLTSLEVAPAPAPFSPLAALPGTPAVAPAPMPHMERLLPYQVRTAVPNGDAPVSQSHETHLSPNTTAQLLARIQPVMPPVSEAELKALLPTFAAANPDHLDLLWPVETRTISSAWGPRMRTKTVKVKDQRKKRIRYKGRHKGIDFTAAVGTSVFAAMDGQVVLVGKHKQYGNYVVVDHGNGVETLYAHHHANLVRTGDVVHRGQKIATVGRTGNATGPHLHFELKINGVHQNPLPALNDEEEAPVRLTARNQF